MTNPIAPAAGTAIAADQLPDGSTRFKQGLIDSAGLDVVGAVGSNPDANTLLGRLKALWTGLTAADTGIPGVVTALTSATLGLPKIVGALVAADLGLPGIVSAIAGTASADRIVTITPSANALNPVPKALIVTASGTITIQGTDAVDVVVPVTAGQILPIRARKFTAATGNATVAALI